MSHCFYYHSHFSYCIIKSQLLKAFNSIFIQQYPNYDDCAFAAIK